MLDFSLNCVWWVNPFKATFVLRAVPFKSVEEGGGGGGGGAEDS